MMLVVSAVMFAAALRLNAAWFDAHILPNFVRPRESQWAIAKVVRIGLVLAGCCALLLALLFLSGRIRGPGIFTICTAFAAGIAAVLSSEAVLHIPKWHALQARRLLHEPQRRPDAHFGWTHLPGHSGREYIGERWIDYAFDRRGYRVSASSTATDPAAPSILFAGESVMLGVGLKWQETIPARVGASLRVQAINLAVTGYSTDQALMRVRSELPRFTCPLGVIMIFMPSFLARNIHTDRPYLDSRLQWHEPVSGWRLAELVRYALGYGGAKSIDEGIIMTTAALRASRIIAERRGAWALTIVPVFMPESAAEQSIRHRVLNEAGLDRIIVPLDRRLRIAGDGHPDARAAAIIASAIVARLRSRGLSLGTQRQTSAGLYPCNAS
ncbi:MAG TPA: hypothetical protein VF467_15290 [Afipia sp.]